ENSNNQYSRIINIASISDIQASDIIGDGIQDIWISETNGSANMMISDSVNAFRRISGLNNYSLYEAKSKIVDINNDGKKEVISLGLSSLTESAQLTLLVMEYSFTEINSGETEEGDTIYTQGL
ncbi:MAG: hypothetical protein ACKVJK_17650, partial [Methylophagaceae bacterium]